VSAFAEDDGTVKVFSLAWGRLMAWMAWTWQTAGFFGLIAAALVVLTLLASFRPETPRRGLLRFPTTRGDRFFVSLLGAAYIFILWMRFGGDVLWYPLAASLLFAAAMFRYA
jgi:predicted small integral membrane protein